MRTDHRPWPIPSKPWRMKQVWHRLLFAHWPVAADVLAPLIPGKLKLDLFEGQAWIGVVPFHMSGIRLRGLPPVPFTSSFAEINVRTYVTNGHASGVYFFSLDAAHLLAVKAARQFYHLPYYYAEIGMNKENEEILFRSNRIGADDKFQFEGKYRPISEPFVSQKGTLDYWLTERYCLYSHHKDRLFRCDILHEPWMLQHAEAEIFTNTLGNRAGVRLPPTQPLLHYSERLDVLTWGLEEVKS
ncbi:YqjF family protein [Cohnella faecalis]|uniref:DUF2071 domain-containing protein n=1 Tax=Cohnella faecalis TaxID=2315694 RepID=A0A398CCT3_9BACL|nr:DUF2071 domain-containing protein [Cohnella faecalis]RIE00225.1 DUF2071 domain-containing protein [Cohnella faecalis]